MAAKTTLGVETYSAPREHRSYRLPADVIAAISDVARGVAEGESGLKSCGMADASVAAVRGEMGNREADHRGRIVYDDADECFNAVGDMLAAGWSHSEVKKRIVLGTGAVHLLALERYIGRIDLSCDADVEPLTEHTCRSWSSSRTHQRRQRARKALGLVRDHFDRGAQHFAVLHIVYGWPDPFVNTIPKEARVDLGNEFGPLARYTDVVEARRQEMIRAEVARAMRASDGTFPLVDIAARAARADRCLSSGDALRDGVGPFPEPGLRKGEHDTVATHESRKAARKEREAEHNAKREAFITAIRTQANAMLTEASEAMRDAWAIS